MANYLFVLENQAAVAGPKSSRAGFQNCARTGALLLTVGGLEIDMQGELASRSLSGRIVLLCLADLEYAAETPAHTGEIIGELRDLLDAIDEHLLDSLSEAAVNRALNRLEADGLVEMSSPSGTSPTGKGRPQYTLAADPSDIVSSLADDDEVAPLAEHVSQ